MRRRENIAPDYVAGIDGLRAIAVLAVLFHHAEVRFLSGGFTGVDVFFVISGYVISKSLSGKSLLGVQEYLFDFYKRRIIRIFPALLACLFVTSVASVLFIPSSWLSSTNVWTGLGAFFGLSNFVLVLSNDGYFSQRVAFNPFLHTWSLAVEEQFYLIFPLLYYGWLKFKDKQTAYGLLWRGSLLGLAVLSLAYAQRETLYHHDQAYYLLPSRFWELAAGALLFNLHAKGIGVSKTKTASNIYVLFGAVALCIGFVYAVQTSFPFPWALLPVFGTMLLIAGVVNVSGNLSAAHILLQSRIPTYLGKASYSLYLWHWPVISLFRWTVGFDRMEHRAIALIITFILATASFHFIEAPVRSSLVIRRQRNRTAVKYGLAAVLVSCIVTAGIFSMQSRISLSVTRDRYTWYQYPDRLKGLLKKIRESELIDRTLSRFRNKAEAVPASHDLFVVGDSHAGAYSAMLYEVSDQLGIKVYKYYFEGCSIANLIRPVGQFGSCGEFIGHALAQIEKKAKPGDIVFLTSLRMNTLGDQLNIHDEGEIISAQARQDAVKNRQLALEEASELIDRLRQKKVHVLLDAPMPIFKSPPFRCSDWFNHMNPICSSGFIMSRDFLLKHREPVMDSIAILKKRHSNLSIWDPFFVLCKDSNCSAFDGDKPLFFDQDHLSGHGARALAPSFREKLLEIWRL